MTDKVSVKKVSEEFSPESKAQYLQTAGGKITRLRCQAKSTRTKMQCGRPALAISSKQLCQYHGGRLDFPRCSRQLGSMIGLGSLQKFEQN